MRQRESFKKEGVKKAQSIRKVKKTKVKKQQKVNNPNVHQQVIG